MNELRVLIIDDSESDASVVLRELSPSADRVQSVRVAGLDALRAQLALQNWDLVISEFRGGGFNCCDALDIVRRHDPHLPFLVVSWLLSEEDSADIIRAGASDCVMKQRLKRLPIAVERELRDAELARESDRRSRELELSERRFKTTFERAPIGIGNAFPSGQLLRVNERFAEILGYPASELIGRSIGDFSHPDDRELGAAFAVKAGGGEMQQFERRYIRRDGSIVWANVTLTPAFGPDGTLDTIIGLVEDITERKTSEAALRSREEQLAQAQEIAHLGSWEVDLQTKHRTWSAELFRIYGLDAAAGVPSMQEFESLVHPDDLLIFRQGRAAMVEGQDQVRFEYRIRRGGEDRVLATGGRLIRDAAGQPLRMLGVTQDITDRSRAEAAIHRRALEQTAVAQLGQIGLSSSALDFVFEHGAATILEVLSGDVVTIWKRIENGFLAVCSTAKELEDREVDRTSSPFAKALETGVEVFTEQQNGLDQRGAAVLIPGDAQGPWGLITAHGLGDLASGEENPLHFLQSVALVLGHAIDRRRAEVELRVRASQQSAIAELGRLALAPIDDTTINRACELVMSGLGVEFSLYLQAHPETETLLFRAGRRWLEAPPVPVPRGSQGVHTMASREVVVVPDYAKETRFHTSHMTGHGIRSGVTVLVASANHKFGVLTAQTRKKKTYFQTDIHFMESLASVLAEAMERDAARLALIESERRYRTVIEGASEIIYTVSNDGILTSVNPAFETLTGWPIEEWIGRPFLPLLHEDDRESMKRLSAAVNAGDAVSYEIRVLGKDGRRVVLEGNAFPRVEDGVVVEHYGFARDVTTTVAVQKERDDAIRELRLVLESTTEGIYTLNDRGICTMANPAAAQMIGRTVPELVGKRPHILMHARYPDGSPYPLRDCAIQKVFETGKAMRVSGECFWRADGTPVFVEYAAAPMLEKGQVCGVVVTYTDVSEQKRLESQLERANRLSGLGRLAATIAHEFNNVLMGISPFVEVLRRDSALSDRSQAALRQIGNSVQRGKGVTEEILRFTRSAEPAAVDLVVGEWLRDFEIAARSVLGSHTLEIDLPADRLVIRADPRQLEQVITNLLINARDAMKVVGRVIIRVRRNAADSVFTFGVIPHPEKYVQLSVIDSGAGIDAATLEQIFEPLFTTKQHGTGLGLAVTHQVVKRHGGEVFAESVLGRGTTFHLFFPLAGQRTTQADEPQQALLGAGRKILLVEDDVAVAHGLVALLESEGFEVVLATTGEEGLKVLPRVKPDAVILDVRLPDMDGRDVYQHMAKKNPDLPVVFSTAHADEAEFAEYTVRPNVGFLRKPYDIAALLDALRRVTGS